MSIAHEPSRPQLRACVEALVAAAPAGITTRRIRDEVSRRVDASGRGAGGGVPVLAILGQLLVEGRIDEHDGVWIAPAQAAPMAQPQHRRQAA